MGCEQTFSAIANRFNRWDALNLCITKLANRKINNIALWALRRRTRT